LIKSAAACVNGRLGELPPEHATATANFAGKLVDGLEADAARAGAFVEQSLAVATEFVPEIGYAKATAPAKEAYRTGQATREVAVEKSGIPEQRLEELLDPESQASPD
jgi:fumarate hydratase class II